MIDWNGCRENYNRRNKTNYADRKAFLGDLYSIHKSCKRVARIIYVNEMSVYTAMRQDNIELLPKGHRLPTPNQKKLLAQPTEAMIINEIEKKTELCRNYIRVVLRQNNRSWLKGGNRTRRLINRKKGIIND